MRRRSLLRGALLALMLAFPAVPCPSPDAAGLLRADASQSEKNKSERCKRSDGTRESGKNCPDGGERLPQDKRSPLNNIPPLSPLVA